MKAEIISEKEMVEKDVKVLVNKANNLITKTIRKINYELINMYWSIGKVIVQYKNNNNSKYGDNVVKRLSEKLYIKYGAGFSWRNIYNAIKFYTLFPKLPPATIFNNISWSHLRELFIFNDIKIINFYLNEVVNKNLTKLELRKYIKTKGFERTIFNQRKGLIKNEIELTLKDPIILNIENKKHTEKELEDEIIKNIFTFMNEIGNNIFLRGRQYKINHNGLIYKVDIVLYDKDNKCFILIDLKINKVSQKDISQMKFYVDYFNKHVKDELDQNTIGLILVETKDIRVENSSDIYQIKYLNELPKNEELLKIINENKIILLKTENLKLGNP